MKYCNLLFGTHTPRSLYPWGFLFFGLQSKPTPLPLCKSLSLSAPAKWNMQMRFVILLLWLFIILNTSLKILRIRVLIIICGGIKHPKSQLMPQLEALHCSAVHPHHQSRKQLQVWSFNSPRCWPSSKGSKLQRQHSRSACWQWRCFWILERETTRNKSLKCAASLRSCRDWHARPYRILENRIEARYTEQRGTFIVWIQWAANHGWNTSHFRTIPAS